MPGTQAANRGANGPHGGRPGIACKRGRYGVEGPSTDRPNWSEFPSHRVCRDRQITHYEWLVNLEELIGKGEFFFSGVPLKIGKGSGSPVRAFAILD